jgi:hypothetical protein
VSDRDDLHATRRRAEALETEVEQLREKVASLQLGPRALATVEEVRRRRVARLLLVGGGVAGLSGVFAHSIFIIVCGLGWIFGGAAVASTLPKSND